MILVTGISGLTGKFLYKEIKENLPSVSIRYFVRQTSDISWMDKNENVVYGNLLNSKDMDEAIKGIEIVLHLAPRHNLHNILDCCLNSSVKRLIYVNSTGIYSKFKRSNHADLLNEKFLKNSDLIYTIIRPTMIYGNEQDGNISLLTKLMNKLLFFPILGDGKGLMHPIYAGDLAKVIVNTLKNEKLTRFKEYNVAGKSPVSYKNLLLQISKALGKRVVFIKVPYKIALFAGKIGDRIPNRFITHEKVLRLIEDKTFDYSDAQKDLDFNPISFEEGIHNEVTELRKKGII